MTEAEQRASFLEGRQAGARYAMAAPAAPAGLAGARLVNRPGSSLEFMDHRDYQPGDDLRRVDWAAYARSDRLTVKLYRQEATPHLDLLVDASRSMGLEGTPKGRATGAVAALLATAAENAGFTFATWLGGAEWRSMPSGNRPPTEWLALPMDDATSPDEGFRRAPPSLRPGGMRVLLSDLLWLGDPMAAVGLMADRAAAVVVVQLLAREDTSPPERGNLRVEDAETGEQREVFVDARAQQRYRENLARHQQNWSRAVRQVGGWMTTLVAEDVLAGWDLSDLVAGGVLKVGGR